MLDPIQEKLAQTIAALLITLGTAVAGTIGGMVNAWLARRKQHAKDLVAAKLKIADLCKRSGVELDCLSKVDTIDDMHDYLRRISARLDELEKAKQPSEVKPP